VRAASAIGNEREVERPRGCPEATGVSEVRLDRAARNKKKRRAQTEASPPKRAGIVKCQLHRSLGHGCRSAVTGEA